MKTNIKLIAIALMLFSSCSKDFLNEKPSNEIVQPITLDNMVSLLENPVFVGSSPALPIMSADEYEYKDFNTWKSLPKIVDRNVYTWMPDLYGDQVNVDDWSQPYTCIFYTNNVITGLENIPINQGNTEQYMLTKGWAYFNRAYFFYLLASNFCKSYDSQTAGNDLGLPLKISPDINVIMQRSTLKETYELILQDLSIAERLLKKHPIPTEKKNRPSLTAVYAFQAKIYLNMREYEKAEIAADNCLGLYSNLIDYNSIGLPSSDPFLITNVENIFASTTVGTFGGALTSTFNELIKINESLLNLYEPEDLRFKIYFLNANGGYVMNKGYLGFGFYPFTGLATDEIYLIKAECAARRGDFVNSMIVLNKLLVNRFPPSKFISKQAVSRQQALDIVLNERRKELVWRGARWEDLKRLNKEGANITITRLLNGITYSLLPNDPKYVFPIPSGEIAFSGILQNLR